MNGKQVKIREAQIPDEYDEIRPIWQSAGPGIHLTISDDLNEIEKKMLRDPDFFLVAVLEGKIIGTVLGGFDGRRGLVYHLAVSHPYRKVGIGEKLMVELEKRLHERGCLRSYLLVTRDNMEAREFYSKRGWEEMDLTIMGKDFN
jgi:ribosomal protein S18 acetylase RimI-like enzyme